MWARLVAGRGGGDRCGATGLRGQLWGHTTEQERSILDTLTHGLSVVMSVLPSKRLPLEQ